MSSITETNICKELNTSSTPVREAMSKLVKDGWIESFPKRGSYVSDFNEAKVCSMIESRDPNTAGNAIGDHIREAAEILEVGI